MKKGKSTFINALLLTGFLILLLAGANSAVYGQEESFFLPELQPQYSLDGQTLYDDVPPLVIVVDPNPDMQGIKAAGPTAADALAAPEAAAATFSITYIAAGGTDPWGQACVAFPAAAKTAFNTAAAIWANKLKSPVPIKISACWADLGSPSILGYSGGQPQHRNFAGAPIVDTWYQSSLANSIAGSDLDPASFDMNITCNSVFSWYFGTDGNPPAGEYDLVTVATHEIGHGLNFSETASYSTGKGSYSTMVYAVASGSANHSPGPVTLGLLKDLGWQMATSTTVPTPQSPSGAITDTTPTYTWTKVTGATNYRYQLLQGTTVIYSRTVASTVCGTSTCASTPTTALNYLAYKWKVQAMVGGVWKAYSAFKTFTVQVPVPTPQSPSSTITDTTPTYTWTKVTGATQYLFQLVQGTTVIYTNTVASTACGASTCSNTPATALGYLAYKWKARAIVGSVWGPYSAFKTFTVSNPAAATAGFWQAPNGVEFYVTTNQANVDKFALTVTVTGCGTYKITRKTPVVPIVGKNFSFGGTFYASGTFDTLTSAHGTAGLSNYYISFCGFVSGQLNWTATWKDTSQPTLVADGAATSVIAVPAAQGPNSFTVNPD